LLVEVGRFDLGERLPALTASPMSTFQSFT
jgi:hypothetical protein